jgi:iron complex transport system substrate-binding protein
MSPVPPFSRIVCLTEEPTEILYALGEEDRIVGISAYTVRPPEASREKPVVSAFVSGSVQKIKALEPDLVVGFSDIQADLARDLIREGLQVLIFNQRSLEEILDLIFALGRMVGAGDRAGALVKRYREDLDAARMRGASRAHRPRVYFEEWLDPTICGIRWVSELIEIAGGIDVFAERARSPMAKDRLVKSEEVVEADPEVYIASWCGKPFDRGAALARPGFDTISAVREKRIYEMDPSIILQPGPACLTDGLSALEEILHGQS